MRYAPLWLAIAATLALLACASRRSVCGEMNKIDCDQLQQDMDRAGRSGDGKAPEKKS